MGTKSIFTNVISAIDIVTVTVETVVDGSMLTGQFIGTDVLSTLVAVITEGTRCKTFASLADRGGTTLALVVTG